MYFSLNYSFDPTHLSNDSKVVLLVHGFASNSQQTWVTTGWVKKLIAQGYEVILMDLPWHTAEFLKEQDGAVPLLPAGKIQPVPLPSQPSPEENLWGAVLKAVATELAPLAGQLHGIGYSLGARLLYDLSLKDPALFKSLTLGGFPVHHHLSALQAYLEHRDQELLPELQQVVASSIVKPNSLQQFVSRVRPTQLSLSPDPTVPLHFIVGGKDSIAQDSQQFATELSKTQNLISFTKIPGRNHVNLLTSGVFKKAAISTIETASSISNSGSIWVHTLDQPQQKRVAL